MPRCRIAPASRSRSARPTGRWRSRPSTSPMVSRSSWPFRLTIGPAELVTATAQPLFVAEHRGLRCSRSPPYPASRPCSIGGRMRRSSSRHRLAPVRRARSGARCAVTARCSRGGSCSTTRMRCWRPRTRAPSGGATASSGRTARCRAEVPRAARRRWMVAGRHGGCARSGDRSARGEPGGSTAWPRQPEDRSVARALRPIGRQPRDSPWSCLRPAAAASCWTGRATSPGSTTGERLVADAFFNGREWRVGAPDLGDARLLELHILPPNPDAEIGYGLAPAGARGRARRSARAGLTSVLRERQVRAVARPRGRRPTARSAPRPSPERWGCGWRP